MELTYRPFEDDDADSGYREAEAYALALQQHAITDVKVKECCHNVMCLWGAHRQGTTAQALCSSGAACLRSAQGSSLCTCYWFILWPDIEVGILLLLTANGHGKASHVVCKHKSACVNTAETARDGPVAATERCRCFFEGCCGCLGSCSSSGSAQGRSCPGSHQGSSVWEREGRSSLNATERRHRQ